MARPEAGLRATGAADRVASLAAMDVGTLTAALAASGAQMTPLFGSSEERVRGSMALVAAAAPHLPLPDLSVYYRVLAPAGELSSLAKKLMQDDSIVAAYVKPPAEPAQVNDMVASAEPAPPVTPDFTARQFYLEAGPGGIDARFAWTRPGGSGTGVRVIDVEGAWRFSHEDLLQNQGGVVGGTQSSDIGWRNHGTAVVGVIGSDRNGVGTTGIAPDAQQQAISIFGTNQGSARAIRDAADRLGAGDLLLIELHRPGPRFNFQSRNDQRGYIAVEWWPDDWAAIQYATAKGVIVVEAAGNGAENLDDAVYAVPGPGFPSTWTNPFNRANRDAGAIVVGAGAPPPGTHGRDHGPDRSRLDFSNFGACIDVQGIGREITTTGYGDLQGGPNEDEWYTDTFSGTSSSSPIVVGALACVQGILRAAGRTPLTPPQARMHLRNTGSPQQDAPGRPATQRIGTRPDVRALVAAVLPSKNAKSEKLEKLETKEGKREIKEKELKREVKEGKLETKERLKEFTKEFSKELTKERKEFKEPKEFKEIREGKGFFELGRDRLFPTEGGGSPAGELDQRLAQLEATVTQLAHFIGGELRPDLGGGALRHEADLDPSGAAALSAELERAAIEARQAKDDKDLEKLRES